jgi:hypothetical protein
MKTITVAYWSKFFYDITGIEHNTVYEYSKEKRNEIIDLVLDKGLNIMIQQLDTTLVMWIDNKRFRQS